MIASFAFRLMIARMDALAVGALIALVLRGEGGAAALTRWVRPVILVAGATLVVLFVWRRGLNTEDLPVLTIGFSALALLFGAVIAQAVTAPAYTLANRLFSQ